MMTDSFKILPAVLSDVPTLVKLVNSAYRGESSKQGWTTEADLLDGFRTDEADLSSILQSKTDTILKYCNEINVILACVHLQHQQHKIYLGMLTVSPELQAKGIGKKLLSAAEQFAVEQQFNSIVMTVISVRTELIEWYEKRGYRKTGERKPFPVDQRFGIPKQPLEFIVLEKKLVIV